MIYLDTHVVAWLYGGLTSLLPASVRKSIEENDLLVSPAVVLELQYLFEIDKADKPASTVMESLERDLNLKACTLPFSKVVSIAVQQAWTRDPFDRLIVSHAIARSAPLITKDRLIRENCHLARWATP